MFDGLNDLQERCPTCHLGFEREEGYWLGAMVVSMAAVLVGFLVVFLGTMLVTWPDVPWTGVTIAGVVVNAAIPLLGYGWAKTTWLGLDMSFNPTTTSEEAEAVAAAAERDDEA